MKFKRLTAILIASVCFFSHSVFAYASLNYSYFQRLMNYISQLYIDENVEMDEIVNNAIAEVIDRNPELVEELLKAAFSQLDKYSEYYTPEEYQKLIDRVSGNFYGIGVELIEGEKYIEIVRCIEGGGAEKAGILAGDKIFKVDGEDVTGATITDIQNLVLGEINTNVSITVLRGDKEFTFTVTRSPVVTVSAQTVGYAVLPDNIGYILMVNFADDTAKEFKTALDFFDNQGITNIILDLRDNPGGYLDSAIDVAKMIVPKGIIARTVFRQSEKNITFYSDLKQKKYNFSVLVNEGTASAAELLASAMQDSKVGYLVGETTYGKGVIQDLYMMPEGGFKLTTGYYVSRNGREINGVGVEPDRNVTNQMRRVNMKNYTQFDYKIKWKVGDRSDSVRAAKERLSGLGFYFGKIDNFFDEALKEAVYDFQKATGLFPYGVLDISTQVRIENEFYVTEEEADTQLEVAYEYLGGNRENLE